MGSVLLLIIHASRKKNFDHSWHLDRRACRKSGIKQYDKIVEIGGTSLEGLTTEEATTLLKGPKGTTVTLKVLREGLTELLTFTITRDIIKEQQSLCFYLKQQHMYYLSLSMFAENSVTQLEQLLTAINKNNQKVLFWICVTIPVVYLLLQLILRAFFWTKEVRLWAQKCEKCCWDLSNKPRSHCTAYGAYCCFNQ